MVDADGDGRVTREELADYFRQFGGGAVQLQPTVRTSVPPAVDAALFALLDTNKDGKLSRDELAAAAYGPVPAGPGPRRTADASGTCTLFILRKRQPHRPSPPGIAGNGAVTRPFLIVPSTDDGRAGLMETLRRRYGARGSTDLNRFTDRPADVELIGAPWRAGGRPGAS